MGTICNVYIRLTTLTPTDLPQHRKTARNNTPPGEGRNTIHGVFLPKKSNSKRNELLQLMISFQEIKETEEHARGHLVDTIGKIQPVNNSTWKTTQFPPQTIAKGVGKKKGDRNPD